MTTTQQPRTSRAADLLALAAAARTVQLAIRAQLMRDVTKLWPALDKNRLGDTFPGWLNAMQLLVRTYHQQSATAAASAYRASREAATLSPAPRSLIKLAPVPNEEWTRRAFAYAAGQMNQDTARPNTALSTTLGSASRIALEGGKTTTNDTVQADPVAVGWYFVTDPNPCYFCALIASRGVVFKEKSFARSDPFFTGSGSAKVHDHCGCNLAPAFTRDQLLPDVSRRAAEVYKNRERGGKDALLAFRQAWEGRVPAKPARKAA